MEVGSTTNSVWGRMAAIPSSGVGRFMPSVRNQTASTIDTQREQKNLIRCLRAHAVERPHETAFMASIDGHSVQTTMTYAQLDRRARAVAAFLQDAGLVGQRVILAYPPGIEFIAGFYGTLYAGCVAVPACPPRQRFLDRFQSIVSDAGALMTLSTDATIAQLNALMGEAALTPYLATDTLSDELAERWVEHEPASDSLAMLQYTSGSTSQPKGVMLSHANLFNNTSEIARSFEIQNESLGVFWLPAYHDMGLVGGVLVPVYVGRPSINMAPTSFLLNPIRWLEAISRSRATISGGPNFAYDLCVRKITAEQRETLDLSSWSVAFIGAEAVQPATLERFAEAFAPCGFKASSFFPCYGLAEATLMVTAPAAGAGAVVRSFDHAALAENRVEPLPDGARNARVIVGCGESIPQQTVAIVDTETLATAAPDRIGEIWVAGESIAQGYWHDAAKTDARFHAHLSDTGEGPFLRTGDLGFMYDNQLYVTGRIDDLIIVRGLNHHPHDIEATARKSHALLQSGFGAAFAVGDGDEQRLVLIHEVERDGATNLTQVVGLIRAAVLEEHGLALDAVVLIRCGTIPKTTSGKVQRRASRAAFLAGEFKPLAEYRAQPQPAPLATKTPTVALAAVCQHALQLSRSSLTHVTPETPIASLGLDSLQRVELVAALDKSFGKHLPDTVYSQAKTLGDLAAAVQKHLIDRGANSAVTHGDADTTVGIPREHYDFSRFPEYLELKRHERMLLAVADDNPYFRVDEGDEFASAGKSDGGSMTHVDGRELTNFCAYDYVGMAHDPFVAAETKAAIDRYGTSASASRLVSGEKQVHRDLESAIAEFLGTQASIVFVSGHATNVTTISHLMGPQDLVVHDILAHNSILQGARQSGATCRGFAHNDWRELDAILTGLRGSFRRVLIAIEGIYSMDGDSPDLARFVAVKKKHGAMLLVDEAHSLGTIGKSGRGIGEHAGVGRGDVELWMGTLSKSLASCGGYIAGSAELVEYLKYTAPGFVYSVGISPPNTAAALAALTLLRREPSRVARLRELSGLLLRLATERGLNTGRADASLSAPVIPIVVGNSVKCLLLSRALFHRGINVLPILYPAVSEQSARLRFFITINHTESQIRSAVDAVASELAKLR